jgi:hypothetical protein
VRERERKRERKGERRRKIKRERKRERMREVSSSKSILPTRPSAQGGSLSLGLGVRVTVRVGG